MGTANTRATRASGASPAQMQGSHEDCARERERARMHLKNLRRSRESKLNPSAAKLQRIAAFETWLAKRPVVAGPQLLDRPALHREFMALRKREQNLAAGARLRARLRGEQLPPVGPSPPPFAQVAAQPAPPIALPPPEHWSPERGEAPDSTAEYGPVSDDGAEGSAAAAATAMGVALPPSPPHTLHPPAPQPAASMLPPIVLCGPMELPRVVSYAARPGPQLPGKMANGAALPDRVFNPFDAKAPRGTIEKAAREIATCVAALLQRPMPAAADERILVIHLDTLASGSTRALDKEMAEADLWGFIICTDRDVLLAALRHDLAAAAFHATAKSCGAQHVAPEAPAMAELIRAAAEQASTTFTNRDAFTTRFGYSLHQVHAG